MLNALERWLCEAARRHLDAEVVVQAGGVPSAEGQVQAVAVVGVSVGTAVAASPPTGGREPEIQGLREGTVTPWRSFTQTVPSSGAQTLSLVEGQDGWDGWQLDHVRTATGQRMLAGEGVWHDGAASIRFAKDAPAGPIEFLWRGPSQLGWTGRTGWQVAVRLYVQAPQAQTAEAVLTNALAALLVESAGRTVVLVDPLLPTDRQRLQLQWRLLQPELTLLSLAQSPPIPASSNASTLLEAQLSWRADLETQLFLPTPLQAPEHIRQVLVMPPQVKPAAPGV